MIPKESPVYQYWQGPGCVHQLPAVDFYHPEMQEVLLKEAARAGVEVQRGAAGLYKLSWVARQFCVAEPTLARDEHYQCAKCNPRFLD